jgi:hypothetical protein
MSELDDLTKFLGRAGCLYVKVGLCPPFSLKESAEAWLLEGISSEHCVSEIESYLGQHSGRHRCGSGDDSLPYVDYAIRKSWADKHRPPRAKPERNDRYFQRISKAVTDPIASPNFAARVRPKAPTPPPQKPLEKAKAFLKRELANGEVATVKIELSAKDEGIALRTLDRARRELMVVSRRSGFAKTGRSWLSLPTMPNSP